mgnify:CR=1 FL=1
MERKGIFTIANLLVSILLIVAVGLLGRVFGPVWMDLYNGVDGLSRAGVFLAGLSPILMVVLYILYSAETGTGNVQPR